jgi:hypothetical protein
MADPADKAPDPKALEVKYTYKDHQKDDDAIKKVETAIEANFPASYVTGLVEKGNNAPISREEYEEQTKEARAKEAQERLLHPDDVKKEEQESPPGKLETGVAAQPSIQKPHPTTSGPKEPAKGAKGGEAKAPGKASAAPSKPGAEPQLKPPHELALAGATTGEADLDKWLNDYPHKSGETTERLSKIKEMGSIAKGFDGQVEKYVQNGSGGWESAKGGLVNFLGKKEMSAAFGENPYAKVEGGLGTIMRGLSRFQNVVSIVGNVCGKIGMVLTVVGLLGMILPPLGAAVSAVARVLNVVGIVCDAIGFALSGILTGLNGVVLAKQIGKGASNEEKAATADMMMTEATSAGSHVMSLAMSYGPGFMKGFKNASKGVIGQLFQRFKGAVGKFAAKTLGPVANWAKNIGYKMGFGLEKSAGEGLFKKAWNAPATMMEKVRGTKLVTKINESRVMQGLEAKATKLNNVGWVNKVDGLGEKMGEHVGNWQGKGTMAPDRFSALAAATEAETALAIEQNAAKNAGNRERAKIDKEITQNREVGNNELADHRGDDGKIPEQHIQRSDAAYKRADELEQNEAQSVSNAEKEAGEEAKLKRTEDKKEKEEKESEEKKQIAEFNKDPKTFQAETNVMQRQREFAQDRLKDPNLPAEERKAAEEEAKKLRHEIDERRLIAIKAGGGETPENLWQAGKLGKEAWEQGHFKSENLERLEAFNKNVENKAGGHADTEKAERAEHHAQIGEWANEECKVEEVAVYEHVEGMLEGVDEERDEHEHEGDEHEQEQEGDAGGGGNEDSPNASFEPMTSMGPDVSSSNAAPQVSNDEQKAPDTGAGGGAGSEASPLMSVAPVPAPAPAPGAEPEDKLADVPELAYWPKLSGDSGEFAQGAKELFRMKQIAYAFQKSQIEARRKALETVATLAKSSEDANLKQAHAMDHAVGINGTVEEATKAGASADHGTQQADAGSAQQASGRSNSDSGKQPKPDPGEKPSRWHPIKRLWWYVKKWASDKAASVFGWIQDQIASMVLRGLCGVSMQDMRNYTTALHHRMQFSQLVGKQGQDKAKGTMDAALNTKSEAKSYSDQALDDAKECDQNVTDATTFIADVEATEQDVAKQQEAAKAFLADLRAAVAAERAKKKEDQLKKAADATKLAAPPIAAAAVAAVAAAPAPRPKKKPKEKQPAKEPKQISPAAVGKVQNAATYVSSKAPVVLQKITTQREELAIKLRSKFENKKSVQPILAQLKTGENIVAEVKTQTAEVTAAMGNVNSHTPANASALHSSAGTVKSEAKKLDSLATEATEKLNWSFKLAYDKLANVRNITAYI